MPVVDILVDSVLLMQTKHLDLQDKTDSAGRLLVDIFAGIKSRQNQEKTVHMANIKKTGRFT